MREVPPRSQSNKKNERSTHDKGRSMNKSSKKTSFIKMKKTGDI